jgi:hypothetical protein
MMKNYHVFFVRTTLVSLLLLFFICLSTPSSAPAFDGGIQPRITTGIINYTLKSKASASTRGDEYTFKDTMPFIGIGATIFANKFYLDFYGQWAFNGTDNFTKQHYESPSPPVIPSHYFWNNGAEIEFDRRDYSVAAGYSLTDYLSLFLGYRVGQSSAEEKGHVTKYLVDDGSLTGIPGLVLFDESIGEIDLDYQNQGPFLGAACGYQIKDKGSLTLNVAVAYLEGEIDQSGDFASPISGRDYFNIETSGDSVGISLGVAWRGRITEQLGYSFSVDGHQYDFEADDPEKPDFSETVYAIRTGLSYEF